MRYRFLLRAHIQRVKGRAFAGGHSASETTLRRIYESSMANLARAIDEFDIVQVHDNTPLDSSHPLILEAHDGVITFLAPDPPAWLRNALELD